MGRSRDTIRKQRKHLKWVPHSETWKGIDGSIIEESKKLAFCICDKHKGYLNKRLLDEHECLKKNCRFLKKLEHPYWVQRNVAKQKKDGDKYKNKTRLDIDNHLTRGDDAVGYCKNCLCNNKENVTEGLIRKEHLCKYKCDEKNCEHFVKF